MPDPARSLSSVVRDPRPHVGEPLALDLLNTQWVDDGPRDLLTDVAGLRIWLTSAGLSGRATADTRTLEALLTARTAILTRSGTAARTRSTRSSTTAGSAGA